jgi:integrase/recombinase XerD
MEHSENNHTLIVIQAEQYLATLAVKRFSERTVTCYRWALADFMGHVKKRDVRTIQSRDLEAYRLNLLERRFKPGSIQTCFQAIRGLFRYLEEHQAIFENPAEGLPMMKVPTLLQPVPTEEEMRILLDQPNVTAPIGIRDRAMLELAYSTGIRRQELFGLKASSVNVAESQARVLGKGSKERMVPVGQVAMDWLGRYMSEVRLKWATGESGEALWLASNGHPLGYGALEQALTRYLRKAGINTRIGLHSIRRACATHMLQRGASPLAIQRLLGHATLDNLRQYLMVSIKDLKQAHENSRVGQ